jgi:hypothetical protein
MSDSANDGKAPVEKNPEAGRVVRIVEAYRKEAEEARRPRMQINDRNFDFYHLKQDYSHKRQGQSREFLPKQAMAVEQIVSFVHQGLIDLGDWFSIEPKPGNAKPLMTRDEARAVIRKCLDETNFFTFIQDALKSGLLGSLMIAKVHGRMFENPTFFTEKKRSFLGSVFSLKKAKKESWRCVVDLVRQRDFFPDPTGEGLYVLQDIELDLWQLKEMARARPDIYDVSVIDSLGADAAKTTRDYREKESGQPPVMHAFRQRVVMTEAWGTLVDESGAVVQRNGVCAIANGRLIRKPAPNPFWHGQPPYVVAPIFRVPHSVWHKALMDAPTALNQAQNELYNLILDSGLASVFGVRQVREAWISNADELANGIAPNAVIKVNTQCPPGAKAVEQVATGTLGQEALSVYNMTNAELQAAALSSDLRQGVLPSRSVKATEVVESSNSITSVFTGVGKTIEDSFIRKLLEMIWLTKMQHADDFDSPDYIALFGEARARELAAVSPEERFARTVAGHTFNVFGITQTLNKIKDFRKLTSFLQTISGSQQLSEEFQKRFDPSKLLDEIMKSLDINTDRIKLDEADHVMNKLGEAQRAGSEPPGGPDVQSQVPQAAASSPEGSLAEIPRMAFPNSVKNA